jgi:hypothetical protein
LNWVNWFEFIVGKAVVYIQPFKMQVMNKGKAKKAHDNDGLWCIYWYE